MLFAKGSGLNKRKRANIDLKSITNAVAKKDDKVIPLTDVPILYKSKDTSNWVEYGINYFDRKYVKGAYASNKPINSMFNTKKFIDEHTLLYGNNQYNGNFPRSVYQVDNIICDICLGIKYTITTDNKIQREQIFSSKTNKIMPVFYSYVDSQAMHDNINSVIKPFIDKYKDETGTDLSTYRVYMCEKLTNIQDMLDSKGKLLIGFCSYSYYIYQNINSYFSYYMTSEGKVYTRTEYEALSEDERVEIFGITGDKEQVFVLSSNFNSLDSSLFYTALNETKDLKNIPSTSLIVGMLDGTNNYVFADMTSIVILKDTFYSSVFFNTTLGITPTYTTLPDGTGINYWGRNTNLLNTNPVLQVFKPIDYNNLTFFTQPSWVSDYDYQYSSQEFVNQIYNVKSINYKSFLDNKTKNILVIYFYNGKTLVLNKELINTDSILYYEANGKKGQDYTFKAYVLGQNSTQSNYYDTERVSRVDNTTKVTETSQIFVRQAFINPKILRTKTNKDISFDFETDYEADKDNIDKLFTRGYYPNMQCITTNMSNNDEKYNTIILDKTKDGYKTIFDTYEKWEETEDSRNYQTFNDCIDLQASQFVQHITDRWYDINYPRPINKFKSASYDGLFDLYYTANRSLKNNTDVSYLVTGEFFYISDILRNAPVYFIDTKILHTWNQEDLYKYNLPIVSIFFKSDNFYEYNNDNTFKSWNTKLFTITDTSVTINFNLSDKFTHVGLKVGDNIYEIEWVKLGVTNEDNLCFSGNKIVYYKKPDAQSLYSHIEGLALAFIATDLVISSELPETIDNNEFNTICDTFAHKLTMKELENIGYDLNFSHTFGTVFNRFYNYSFKRQRRFFNTFSDANKQKINEDTLYLNIFADIIYNNEQNSPIRACISGQDLPLLFSISNSRAITYDDFLSLIKQYSNNTNLNYTNSSNFYYTKINNQLLYRYSNTFFDRKYENILNSSSDIGYQNAIQFFFDNQKNFLNLFKDNYIKFFKLKEYSTLLELVDNIKYFENYSVNIFFSNIDMKTYFKNLIETQDLTDAEKQKILNETLNSSGYAILRINQYLLLTFSLKLSHIAINPLDTGLEYPLDNNGYIDTSKIDYSKQYSKFLGKDKFSINLLQAFNFSVVTTYPYNFEEPPLDGEIKDNVTITTQILTKKLPVTQLKITLGKSLVNDVLTINELIRSYSKNNLLVVDNERSLTPSFTASGDNSFKDIIICEIKNARTQEIKEHIFNITYNAEQDIQGTYFNVQAEEYHINSKEDAKKEIITITYQSPSLSTNYTTNKEYLDLFYIDNKTKDGYSTNVVSEFNVISVNKITLDKGEKIIITMQPYNPLKNKYTNDSEEYYLYFTEKLENQLEVQKWIINSNGSGDDDDDDKNIKPPIGEVTIPPFNGGYQGSELPNLLDKELSKIIEPIIEENSKTYNSKSEISIPTTNCKKIEVGDTLTLDGSNNEFNDEVIGLIDLSNSEYNSVTKEWLNDNMTRVTSNYVFGIFDSNFTGKFENVLLNQRLIKIPKDYYIKCTTGITKDDGSTEYINKLIKYFEKDEVVAFTHSNDIDKGTDIELYSYLCIGYLYNINGTETDKPQYREIQDSDKNLLKCKIVINRDTKIWQYMRDLNSLISFYRFSDLTIKSTTYESLKKYIRSSINSQGAICYPTNYDKSESLWCIGDAVTPIIPNWEDYINIEYKLNYNKLTNITTINVNPSFDIDRLLTFNYNLNVNINLMIWSGFDFYVIGEVTEVPDNIKIEPKDVKYWIYMEDEYFNLILNTINKTSMIEAYKVTSNGTIISNSIRVRNWIDGEFKQQ